MRNIFIFLAFLSLLSLGFAQSNPRMVSDIEVTGNKVAGLDKIITQIKTRVNQPYNDNVVSDDIKRIYSLGYFDDISVDLIDEPDNKVKVIFIVEEKPILKTLDIQGAQRIRKSKIIEISGLRVRCSAN
jgi:outer membrane protein insertion porin family